MIKKIMIEVLEEESVAYAVLARDVSWVKCYEIPAEIEDIEPDLPVLNWSI